MNQTDTFPAPVLPQVPENKWQREKTSFRRLLPSLLSLYKGQYVAIHEGQVVDHGGDKLAIAERAYARFGYVPIFVSLVTDTPPPPVRIVSWR